MDVFTYLTTSDSSRKTEALLADLFRSAMTALSSIHEHGFVHRDLKLENLMMSAADESVVKIIDLGEMVRMERGQRVHRSKGRPPGTFLCEIGDNGDR